MTADKGTGSKADEPSDGSSPRSGAGSLGIHLATRAIGLGVVILLGYLTRPLWHGFIYSTLYSPGMVVFGGGAMLTAVVLWFLPPIRGDGTSKSQSRQQLENADSPIAILFSLEGSSGRKVRLFTSILVILFVLSILVGAPVVAVLSTFYALPTWPARVSFAVRVGAIVWFLTAVATFLYARRNA